MADRSGWGVADLTNAEFRMLLERYHNADDWEAGEVLKGYLERRIIFPKLRKLPPGSRADAFQEMTYAAWRAARACMTKVVPKPRNYVVRSVTNSFLSELRKLKRRQAHEAHLDARGEDYAARSAKSGATRQAKDQPHEVATDNVVDALIRGTFKKMRGDNASAVTVKAVDALEMCYLVGNNIGLTEACSLLDFSRTETETVVKTVRRWRMRSQSPLAPLLRILHGEVELDG